MKCVSCGSYVGVVRASPDHPLGFACHNTIRKLVDEMFVNGAGQHATRLVLVDDNRPGSDLGGLCREAIEDRLCKAFKLPPFPRGKKVPRRKGKVKK